MCTFNIFPKEIISALHKGFFSFYLLINILVPGPGGDGGDDDDEDGSGAYPTREG